MTDKKALLWFLVITFAISWPLFLAPLLFRDMDPAAAQLATTGLWALAMWGPGAAAIATTLLVQKKPFRSLNMNRLGPKRYYLWAWFLPAALSIVGGLFALLFGVAKLDLEFTMMREALSAAPGGAAIPPILVVAIQIGFAILLAPFINVLFALGEELGWRGFLLPNLLPLGQWKAILLSGVIWGVWHAPAVAQGLNYPGYPVAGILMMIVFCVLLGTIFAWLYLNTQSPWSAALAHGAVNATAGLPVMFLQPGFNLAFGGTLAAPASWLGMALFIGWLVWSKRIPARGPEEAQTG
ncbi:MAG: CPBP family intramembrane glutamic endopeptidase [Chloroflexota bacterium]